MTGIVDLNQKILKVLAMLIIMSCLNFMLS